MFYGAKPPRPTSADQVTWYVRKHARVRKVHLVDMGKGQEYRFAGGMADGWKETSVPGITQLKQLTFDGWLRAFLCMRRSNLPSPATKIEKRKRSRG